MPDPREWISRVKKIEPPELWEEAAARARSIREPDPAPSLDGGRKTRPATSRRAALVTGIVAGILTIAIVVLAIRTGPTENVGTPTPEVSSLSATHELLERLLSDLWVAEAYLAELQGVLGAAQDDLAVLMDEFGPDPTDAQLQEIETLQERIQAWTGSASRFQAEISQLRVRVDEVRAARAGLLPPPDDGDYPSVATVTCDGDRTGGTHVSTPVVRMQPDGVNLHVVNRISNERVFLSIEGVEEVFSVSGGDTADISLAVSGPGDIEIVCTHAPAEGFTWSPPSHPLWVAPVDSATATPTPEPTLLDPFLLTASLDDEPVTWPEVAFLPAGDSEGEIGVQPCFHCGEQLLPSALAVDRDGSYWVADGFKARIAHFARDGSFIEAFRAEIGSAVPNSSGSADLAFVGDRLYVLLEEGGSRVAPVGAGGPGEPIIVNNEGQGLDVQAVIPGQDELTVMISGAERLLGGYWAFATVDPDTGQVTPSPGVRNSTGSYVDIQPLFDGPPGTFEIRWFHDGHAVVAAQEVRFQLVRRGQDVKTSVGDTYVRTATQWGVATVMSIGDGQGIPVGAWYLEIVPERPSFVFERLPGDGFIGDVRRYLTVGPDGRVYWMRLLEDGLHIYRR